MELTFWGVRGSCPVARPHVRQFGGNTPCLQLRVGGRDLIVDAGTGIRRLGHHLMEQANGSEPPVLPLLITHPHWDHIQGFPHFPPAHSELFHIQIYTMKRPDTHFADLLSGQQESEFFSVPLQRLESRVEFFELEDGETRQIGPYRVTDRRLNHPGIACGYRIEAEGAVVSYVCDVAPSRDLLLAQGLPPDTEQNWLRRLYENQLALAQDADMVIYDTFFTPEWYAERKHWGHSTVEDGVEVCKLARARHLFMFHHNPERTDQELATMLAGYQQRYDADNLRVHVASEGATYRVEAGQVTRCE